ncbi:MAG TPA: hypothetical protein VGE39_09240 [Prosthecobacter sp.]
MSHVTHLITYSSVTIDDFEELAALRIAAMRPSLEHLGRFDPARARERHSSRQARRPPHGPDGCPAPSL